MVASCDFALQDNDRVLFVGDSVTRRTGTLEGLPPTRLIHYTDSWVPVVEKMIATSYPERKIAMFNRAIGGSTIENVLESIEEHLRDTSPTWINLMIGINDPFAVKPISTTAYETALYEYISKSRNFGVHHIILMTPTIRSEDPEHLENEKVREYAAVMKRVSEQENTYLIDTHERMCDFLKQTKQGYNLPLTTDRIHMNLLGNQIIAQEWLKILGFRL